MDFIYFSIRKLLSRIISVILLLMIVLSMVKPVSAQPQKKNILVIMADDLDEYSFDQLLNAGKLPNIKQYIVDKGIRFSNSFVAESLCCPARATFLTGKYPHNTGTYSVIGSESGMQGLVTKGVAVASGNSITSVDWFPSWLDTNSYYTGHIGKFMNFNTYDKGIKPGFNYWRLGAGFDARPGMYYVIKDANYLTPIWPDVFQTKYYGDRAVDFIDQLSGSGETNFFLQVAPHAPHVSVPEWVEEIYGAFSTDIAQKNIVGYNDFNYPSDPNISQRRQVVVVNPLGGYIIYKNDKLVNPLGWTGWTQVGTDTDSFPGTGSLPIVAFNAFKHPDITGIKQHLIRGTLPDGYTVYIRDIIDGVVGAWSVAGTVALLMPNTGNLPVVGFATTNLVDPPITGGDIAQFLVRGDDANGYELYTRARINNIWGATWDKEAEMWDLNSSSFPIEEFNARYLSQGILELSIVRPKDADGTRTIFKKTNTRSFYEPIPDILGVSTKQVLGITSTNDRTVFDSEGEQFSNPPTNNINPSSTYPSVIWGARVYADGNWLNHQADQSYSPSLYPGGIYPAGTLRTDGSNGFTPASGFDIPNISKTNFNNCSANIPWICANWPDINSSVVGSKTQLNYIKRSHLDRLESMVSVDVMVGRIINRLTEQNLLDNTLVVFTSDNGYFQGEHRLGNKVWPYEESIRMPLIIRPPNTTIQTGITNTNTVLNIDLAATIMDYAGLWDTTYQAKVDGRSLKPILDAESTLYSTWRKWFLFEYRYPRDCSTCANWKWAWGVPDLRAIRTGVEATDTEGKNHLYVEYTDDPDVANDPTQYELFDINSDASQIVNKYDDPAYSSKKNLYASLLSPLLACTGSSCRTADTAGVREDLNNDGIVNTDDYAIVKTNYGNTTCGNIADIDGNCIVNILDLNRVMKLLSQ